MGKVYLTGAGPGDVELLTIKALKMIQKADVIVYDRLANEELLKEAKNGAKFIFVGKEDKKHTLPQEQINELLYQEALKNDIVVRLKGGDPFVFGRGGEEALYLKERGIEFEIIPGITSAISAPAYAGIPVTHRKVAVSFRVVTGHEAPNKEVSQIPWDSFKADETIIFLMGLHNIQNIVSNLIRIGKDKNTPVAIISKGTMKEQLVVTGKLDNIIEKSKNIPTPALIVVGEVVKFKDQLQWFK
jgi:uroporphyrin-III C-methyltransferase